VKQGKYWCATQLVHVVFVGVLVFTLASCGGDGNDSSPSSSLSGNYAGTVQDNVVGDGTVQVTLTESNTLVSGTLQTTFVNPQQRNPFLRLDSGTVRGTVNGTSITLTFTPSVATSCPYDITLTRVSDTELTGAYAASQCVVASSGVLNLTRQ